MLIGYNNIEDVSKTPYVVYFDYDISFLGSIVKYLKNAEDVFIKYKPKKELARYCCRCKLEYSGFVPFSKCFFYCPKCEDYLKEKFWQFGWELNQNVESYLKSSYDFVSFSLFCYRTKDLKLHGMGSVARKELFVFMEDKTCCDICGMKFEKYSKLHHDYSHKDGYARGLLCGSCNSILRHHVDNYMMIEKVIAKK